MFRKYIGTKAFYKRLLKLMVPILIQNGITNFVNMLDNIMIGSVGTAEMNGVAVMNQIIMVFTLCIFGAVSGAGIFGAQYAGSGDDAGVRDTFRFKLMFCTVLTAAFITVFLVYGDNLVSLFLHEQNSGISAADVMLHAKTYLRVMVYGFLPAAIIQCYASTLRETGKTVLPMVAGLIAVGINLTLNYILIYGHFGAPALGVKGAAIATVISRYAELAIIAAVTFIKRAENRFIIGAFRSLRVPLPLVGGIFRRGLPLMFNETMWSAGIAFINQSYSRRGLDVVAAVNIMQTFSNVFSVAFLSVGAAIGIVLGQMLGAGKTAEARESAKKLIAFSVVISLSVAVIFSLCAPFIPMLYNTDENVRSLATSLMIICAFTMPLDSFANASYFTLRSGGQAFITILFDSGFVWAIAVPLSYFLSKYTSLPILPLYAICQSANFLKDVLGYVFVHRGTWAKKLVHGGE